MKEYNSVKGWTVSLYTDEGQKNDRNNGYEYLSWSPYDRIQIHITDNFEKFIFPVDKVSWCGVKQQLHLIPYYYIISGRDEKKEAEWKDSSDDQDEYLVRRNDLTEGESYYGLQCIVTVRLNSNLLTGIVQGALNQEKQDILAAVTNHLSRYGEDSKSNFDCISFTTLGSEDFAFMFFADTIEIFSDLIHILRKQTVHYLQNENEELLFSNVCSIIGFNKSDHTYNPTLNAVIKLNAKSLEAKEKIKNIIEDMSKSPIQTFDILQGINVFEIYFSPKDLTLWHKPKGDESDQNILNGDSKLYKELINSSRTYWQSKPIDVSNEAFFSVSAKVFPNNEEINNSNKDENDEIDKNDKNETENNGNHIFSFIFNEYDRMIHLSRCIEWKEILKDQQECLKTFNLYYKETDDEKRKLADGMQAILTHINQACTPIYEVPYHNHFYAGSFDDILKMYYGIIRFIISKGNGINRNSDSKPTLFSFGIRFDSVENIQTSSFATENQEKRFVVFQLPYSALYDFETSAELLVHEVFHYIAPINRKYRNKHLLNIWMEYLLEKLKEFKKFTDIDPENKINNKFLNIFHENLLDLYYKCILETYENFNIYEVSIFTMLEFAEYACIMFCSIISDKLHETNKKIWEEMTNKALKLSLCKKSEKSEAMDVLFLWLNSKDINKGMIELVSAVKEVFCDLFMCAIYQFDFEHYLSFLKKYKAKLRKVIENDDMSLAYRLVIIAAVLRAEYNLEKLSFNLTTAECELIEKSLDYTENEEGNSEKEGPLISRLIRNVNRIGTSPRMCMTIVKTIEKEILYIKNNFEEFGKFNDTFLKNIITKSEKNPFFHQVKMMNSFVNYNKNEDIDMDMDEGGDGDKKDNVEIIPHYSTPHLSERYYTASSMSEYIDAMINISQRSNGQLWYRGVCNCDFSLLPSLLREEPANLSLYAMQVNYLKIAYASTMKYPDLWKGKIQEHVSLLQHYGLPTSLLDFSLDMLTSLHFALNPDKPEDRNKLDDGVWTPIVYAFDSNEYVNAITVLKEEQILRPQYNVSPVLYEVADDEMSEFFPKSMDAGFLISHSKEFTMPYQPCNRTNKFPVPIIIRNSHDRIRVQGGTFVAFSLETKPDVNNNESPYSYMDLKKIELAYEKFQKKKGVSDIKKFLHGVCILPSAIKSIQNDIKELGITKSSVYPELSNIFEVARNDFVERNKV